MIIITCAPVVARKLFNSAHRLTIVQVHNNDHTIASPEYMLINMAIISHDRVIVDLKGILSGTVVVLHPKVVVHGRIIVRYKIACDKSYSEA